MFVRLLALLCVVIPLLTSIPQTSGIRKPDGVPSTCPVTSLFDKPLVPPYPYPPNPYPGGSWFGSDRLWIVGPPVVWKGLSHSTPNDPTFTQKMQWWRQGYDPRIEPIPKLKITGRRLDAPARPLITEVSSTDGARPSMMVGMNFPTLGCWEITGRYEDDELTFVVWIAK
jgi:hypothetical protein